MSQTRGSKGCAAPRRSAREAVSGCLRAEIEIKTDAERSGVEEKLRLTETPNNGLHRFAVLLASATLVLIFVGGLVKSTGSELSVPDWPLAFGKLIPSLKGGVLFEYSHRVVAGIVSILTLAMMLWAILREPRRWVRVLAIVAFGLVIGQAVLGGITVLFLIPLPIAMAHTATANAFFCVVVALAIFTSPWFIETAPREERGAGIALATRGAITTC